VAGALLLTTGVVVVLVSRGGDTAGPQASARVGGDLHTVTTIGDALYVGGHEAVAVSRDSGNTWQQINSLNNADAMGWAVTKDAVLVGGHPGLYRSTDQGATFTPVTGAATVPDVHALGGAGTAVYLASPQAGLLTSTDGGQNWQVRNVQAGRSFMGTILVDPTNPNRLVVPDMTGGLTASTDGGRTFTPLGGPTGAMAAAWNPTNVKEIIAVGMNGAARSSDGGTSWQNIAVPEGTSAVTYAADGRTIYAGALQGEQARTYRSTDAGATWQPTN
jgi:photosystem II stability/assembly factor-like uncharacterized protein